jgi:hypothetical protein
MIRYLYFASGIASQNIQMFFPNHLYSITLIVRIKGSRQTLSCRVPIRQKTSLDAPWIASGFYNLKHSDSS